MKAGRASVATSGRGVPPIAERGWLSGPDQVFGSRILQCRADVDSIATASAKRRAECIFIRRGEAELNVIFGAQERSGDSMTPAVTRPCQQGQP